MPASTSPPPAASAPAGRRRADRAGRALPARAPPRPRWDGRGLARHGRVARPQGGVEVAQAEPRHRPRRRRAVPARGDRRRRPHPPQHRRRPRRVRGPGPPGRRDATRRRQELAPTARRADPAQPRADHPHRRLRRRRPRHRPPRRVRPPRRQARQHPRHRRRPGAAHRLRDRQGPRHLRRRPHQRQRDDGHGQIPLAGAGARPPPRRTGRPLLARPRAVRVSRGTSPVSRRDRRRHRPRPLAARPHRPRSTAPDTPPRPRQPDPSAALAQPQPPPRHRRRAAGRAAPRGGGAARRPDAARRAARPDFGPEHWPEPGRSVHPLAAPNRPAAAHEARRTADPRRSDATQPGRPPPPRPDADRRPTDPRQAGQGPAVAHRAVDGARAVPARRCLRRRPRAVDHDRAG